MAAGADEHELGIDVEGFGGRGVLHRHAPAVSAAVEVRDFVAGADLNAVVGEVGQHLAGERTEVDVGSTGHARQAVDLSRAAVFEHEGQPLSLRGGVVGELHVLEQGVLDHGFAASANVVAAGFSAAVGHVRNLVDEGAGFADDAFVNEVAPELAGDLELFVDVDGLGDVDVAVLVGRRVVELAQGRVAGARVVPCVRAFACDIVGALVDADCPVGLKFVQQGAERCAHDAPADQDDVSVFFDTQSQHPRSAV